MVGIDSALTALDEDNALSNIGANAVLAVSLATLLAAADARGKPLWRVLGGAQPLIPMPMVNIFSGGAHAGRAIDIQDVLVVLLGTRSFAEISRRSEKSAGAQLVRGAVRRPMK